MDRSSRNRVFRFDLKRLHKRTDRLLLMMFVAILIVIAIVVAVFERRDSVASLGLATVDDGRGRELTVTWFGLSTLLFDDGETQILIDGFISRPSLSEVVMNKPVTIDAATINYWLHQYGVWRLAAIIPSHTHFDHAMDIGAIANRSAASIIGSESAASIARGAGVPEDQIVVVGNDPEFAFGQFTVRLIETPHAPIGLRGAVPFDGSIDEPLEVPAPVSAWRAGKTWSIVISHPAHTTLVHASAGLGTSALQSVRADTVFLGVGMLASLGADYMRRYWISTVTTTGAERVVPVHFDDYTQPFGTVALPPALIDNVPKALRALKKLRDTYDKDTRIVLPGFGTPLALEEDAPIADAAT